MAGLRPRGIFVVYAYIPEWLGDDTGGPKVPELLMILDDLCKELEGHELLLAQVIQRHVSEGVFHTQPAAVVQLVGRKSEPPQLLSHPLVWCSGLGYFSSLILQNIMKSILITLMAVAAAFTSVTVVVAENDSSEEIHNTSVLESGTYQVTAKKVDPEEKEIYVTTADGKTLELYFSKDTKLTQGGKEVGFDALKNGQKLQVKVEKVGNKLKPLAVTILE